MIKLNEPFQLWTPSQCENLIERAKNNLEESKVYRPPKTHRVRTNLVSWIELTQEEKDYCWEIIKPFWNKVTWFEHPVQISKYSEGDFYDWHRDEKPGAGRSSIRYLTLTCTLQTAPGATIELRDKLFDLQQGEAVIFYSRSEHKANPPTQGSRWAFTIWYMQPQNKS